VAQNPFPKEGRPNGKPSNVMDGVWPVYESPSVFDWSNVDGDILRAALQCATNQGRNIGIGPAMGGRGVVVTIYMGLKVNPKRFAIDAAELHDLLLGIVKGWSSPSEDVLELMRMKLNGHKPS
jgi:hypothetical protein